MQQAQSWTKGTVLDASALVGKLPATGTNINICDGNQFCQRLFQTFYVVVCDPGNALGASLTLVGQAEGIPTKSTGIQGIHSFIH